MGFIKSKHLYVLFSLMLFACSDTSSPTSVPTRYSSSSKKINVSSSSYYVPPQSSPSSSSISPVMNYSSSRPYTNYSSSSKQAPQKTTSVCHTTTYTCPSTISASVKQQCETTIQNATAQGLNMSGVLVKMVNNMITSNGCTVDKYSI